MNPATWIVTGGAGFIGTNLVSREVRRGRRVINLDALTYAGHRENFAAIADDSNHVFVHGDIGDQALVAELLETYAPDAVVHLAAESHVDRSISDAAAFVMTNVVGTYRLLDTTLAWFRRQSHQKQKAFRFLNVSTDEVYGSLEPDALGFHELSPYAPNSPYAASKAAGDHFVRAYHKTYGLPVLTTHCSNNYGPFQLPEKLIPLMIVRALARKPLPVYGDGLQVRDWIHVDDHCEALDTIIAKGQVGEVYTIGGRAEATNLEVVTSICDLVDEMASDGGPPRRSLITSVPDRLGHDRRYAVDDTKVRAELGWVPRRDFTTGLRDTVQWYLGNPVWRIGLTHWNDASRPL